MTIGTLYYNNYDDTYVILISLREQDMEEYPNLVRKPLYYDINSTTFISLSDTFAKLWLDVLN